MCKSKTFSSQVTYKNNSIVELTLSVVKVEEHDYSIKFEI